MQLKLSEAIRLGSMLRPQGTGRTTSARGTCALGAACPMCSKVVTWRRKGGNVVFTKHVSTESGFACEANDYEFDASSIRAVAKDGRGKERPQKPVARRAGNPQTQRVRKVQD